MSVDQIQLAGATSSNFDLICVAFASLSLSFLLCKMATRIETPQ